MVQFKSKKKHHIRNNRTQKCSRERAYIKFEEHYENKIKSSGNIESEMIKLFNTPFAPSKYKLTDDYYTYINYAWINSISKKAVPKYYVQTDSFRMVQENVYYELIDIVKNYIKTTNSNFSKCVRNVYESLYNLDNKASRQNCKQYSKQLAEQISKGNIYDILASQNRNELISWGVPIVWNVMKDEKNSKIYKSTISPPRLTLYDYSLYNEWIKDDNKTLKYKRYVKNEYIKFVNLIFINCFGENSGYLAEDVWSCEKEILHAINRREIKTDTGSYNIVNRKDSFGDYGFDWSVFAKKLGYNNVPEKFICTSTNYLKNIMTVLSTDWQKPRWHTYYLYNYLRQAIRFNNAGKLIYHDFHGKIISGSKIPYPREIYPIFGLSMCFNTYISNEYISKHENTTITNYVKDMSEDLLAVFKRIIKRNKWLSPSTQKKASLKLEKLKLLVGSPMSLREDPILDYDNKDAFQNLIKISSWRTDKYIFLDGKASEMDIPVIDWEDFNIVGKQSYVVNAYYTANENAIYVPLAYLQEPFIDLKERGIEYNLANLGFTLAHEMSHCLDDLGSQYDENGNLHDWWTPHDKKIFKAKIENVIKQYETFAGYDGIQMDASLSVGENLADISGIAICEEFLRDFQDKNETIVQIRSLSFQSFFVYMAAQGRQKVDASAVKAQLKTNPHPLEKYRTNCPLARLKLFKSIYNIKKGDKMYWSSDDTIW